MVRIVVSSRWLLFQPKARQPRSHHDADGQQYPWYGITSERRTVRGPSEGGKVKVNMIDNFSPTVSWDIPVGRGQPDTLTAVHRDQSFLVWLVAKNEISGDILALRAFCW